MKKIVVFILLQSKVKRSKNMVTSLLRLYDLRHRISPRKNLFTN